jgi:hypothetical protein
MTKNPFGYFQYGVDQLAKFQTIPSETIPIGMDFRGKIGEEDYYASLLDLDITSELVDEDNENPLAKLRQILQWVAYVYFILYIYHRIVSIFSPHQLKMNF